MSDSSEYNQFSFTGGMNLLGDDTRLQPNEYRAGFNLTNREDELDAVLSSIKDVAIPNGLKQELVTFGVYIIVFIAGNAYYRYYQNSGWKQIVGFSMSPTAPRYWSVAVPVSTTNYIRIANLGTTNSATVNPAGGIQTSVVAGANSGNLPGLLIQDNINQPQFIFIDNTGLPTVRTTQIFGQWSITYTDDTNVTVAQDTSGLFLDNREYVPIGNSMTYDDGTLYIASQDSNFIYRSVQGRPLDFVVNVVNTLADNTTTPPFTQYGGGDATTTSYSVGVGSITCLRQMSSGGIFVAASNANFNVIYNTSPTAPTIFGEYTFIRTFLFNANCLSDRAIFDTLGDTRFIDLTGVRSFNAIEQAENEGRNSPFTKTIQSAFSVKQNGVVTTITQDPNFVAGILYDNYELYAVQTSFGPCLAKYDTINGCWTSFDTTQTGGKRIKILAKIELAIQRLFAITEDDELYTLYIGPIPAIATVRTVGVAANILYANTNIKMNNPKSEVKPINARIVMNDIEADCDVSLTPYVNNRLSSIGTINKKITYSAPANESTNSLDLHDVNSQLSNLLFSIPDCEQGWKMFCLISWTGGVITQYSFALDDVQPQNPLDSQGNTV